MSFDFDSKNLTANGNFFAGAPIKAEDLNLLMQEIIDVFENFSGITYYTTNLGYIPLTSQTTTFVFSPFCGVCSQGKGGRIWPNPDPTTIDLWSDASLKMELTARTLGNTQVLETLDVTFYLPQPIKIFESDTVTNKTQIIGKITSCSGTPRINSICFQENK